MAALKTQPTDDSVADFLSGIEHPTRRADALELAAMLDDITGEEPRMWGGSIVGYGSYDYEHESGQTGTWMRIAFAPRSSAQSIYVMFHPAGYERILARLGKHRVGKACLYVNKLADVDTDVLRELLAGAWAASFEHYPA